jgi:hypothetical protein
MRPTPFPHGGKTGNHDVFVALQNVNVKSKGVFGRLGQPRDSHLILRFHIFRCLVGWLGSAERFPPHANKAPQPG